MRITHVVTYISPDGAFGGPVRVALGQAAELAARGHDVTVLAAAPSGSAGETVQAGYRLATFPARRLAPQLGFAGMFAPGLTRALRRALHDTDVVHVHLARDLVTLPAARAARRAGVPLVLQTHGMIDASDHPLARPVDSWETRSALARAQAVLVLTDQEERDIRELAPSAEIRRIGNGVDSPPDLPSYAGRARRVLFLARLHPRKRAVAFVEMAVELARRGVEAEFELVGPDEGEGEAVRDAIVRAGLPNLTWSGPVEPGRTDALLRDAAVYVLPAVDEVFPMSILESLRAGTPVVTTTSLGISELCADHGAALLTDGTPDSLADAVAAVLNDPDQAESLRRGGEHLLRTELSIEAVVDVLERTYATRPGGSR